MRRITATLSNDAHSTLEKLAQEEEKSMSDVLREAVKIKAALQEAQAEGYQLIARNSDGAVREIVLITK